MSKGKKRLQYFSIIMQIVFQAVLLFPWMNLGTWKCNVPWYLIKMLGSGNGLGYVKSSLKPLGALEGLDSQATGITMMLFLVEMTLVLLIQLLGLVNLFFTLKNRHKLMPDVIALIAGCMISYLGADGAVIYRSGISGISICSGGAAGYQLDSGESSGFLGRTEGNAGRSQSQRESI